MSVPEVTKHGSCCEIDVPRHACYIRLVNPIPKIRSSGIIGETPDGDLLIVDYDHDGKILGIELVGDGKPCQWGSAR